jgi:hypothetical protein
MNRQRKGNVNVQYEEDRMWKQKKRKMERQWRINLRRIKIE